LWCNFKDIHYDLDLEAELALNKIDANRFMPNACQKPICFANVTAGTKHVFHKNCVGHAIMTDSTMSPKNSNRLTANIGYLSFILSSLNVLEIIKIETVSGFL